MLTFALTLAALTDYAAANSSQPEGILHTIITASAAQQVRLSLRRQTIARLLDLQARSVKAGHRKPSYSELVDALVAGAGDIDPAVLLQERSS